MQSFPDMAEAHEWTLRRLREMAGRLTEQAYLKASAAAAGSDPEDDEAHARWMLVFDKMARGLRLSIALEAKLARERRWDADELQRETLGERLAPRWRTDPGQDRGGATSDTEAWPRESDRERDYDGLAAEVPLGRRIDRLKAIVEGGGMAGEGAAAPRRFVWRDVPPPDAPSVAFSDSSPAGGGAPEHPFLHRETGEVDRPAGPGGRGRSADPTAPEPPRCDSG
jgi:hypothetical protein